MINKEDLSWLITVPSSDTNFQWHLKDANKETIEAALKEESIGKTKRLALERRLKKICKWCGCDKSDHKHMHKGSREDFWCKKCQDSCFGNPFQETQEQWKKRIK